MEASYEEMYVDVGSYMLGEAKRRKRGMGDFTYGTGAQGRYLQQRVLPREVSGHEKAIAEWMEI